MSAASPPPTWSFASLDLNVFLTGQLVEGSSSDGIEGAQLKLDRNGIRIEHPSLISVTSTPNTHTLHSVNLAKPILSLPVSQSASPSPARARVDGEEGTTNPTEGTIITLHAPLLTPQEYEKAKQSPYYSTNFEVVLDSDDGFLPPKLDLAHLTAPPSPKHNPVSISPSIQRALLSPLLSPQRRAASAGSDLSVPPLSLGLSRQPPTRLQPLSGLPALLPTSNSTKPSLQQVLSSRLSAKSKEMTDELVLLRNKQEAFTKRIKAEFDLLESRVNNFGVGVTAHGGRTRIVKGFNVAGSAGSTASGGGEKEPPVSGSGRGRSSEGRRETSLEREASNSITSPERGRGRRPSVATKKDGSQELITDDERLSVRIQEADRKEEESRGRSRSRTRRSSAKSQEDKAVAEARPGREIEATREDEAEIDGKAVPELIPEKRGKDGVAGGEEGEQEEDSFVPSSHHLVTISEVEEETATSRTPQESAARGRELESQGGEKSSEEKRVEVIEEDHEEEDDHLFDMDEDIESSHIHADYTPAEEEAAAPPVTVTAATPSLALPSTSYRPGSLRPSSMASSFAALLATSASKGPKQPSVPASSAYFTPPPTNIFSNSSPSSRTNAEVKQMATSGMTPEPHLEDYSLHPTQPDPAEEGRDAVKNFINGPAPDVQAAKVGVRQIRDVLAMDAPSHRMPLPVRRRGGKKREESDSEDDFESAPLRSKKEGGKGDDEEEDKFRVGSLPVQMHGITSRNSSKYASSFRPEPERELERKTSVPSRREGMFVHPLPRLTPKRPSTTSPPPSASTMSISKSPIPATSILTGPSSLAQSLKNPPTSLSFSVLAERGQASVVEGGDDDGEGEEEFVPPHVWTTKNQPLEQILGRSVHDFH